MLPQLQRATARRSYHRRSELISGDWANSLSRSSTTGNLFLYNRARPLGARSCRRRSHCRGGVLLTTHGDWLAEAIHLRYRLRNMRFSPKRWTRTQVYEGNSGRTEWGNTTIGGRQRAQRTAIRNLNGTGPEAGPPPTMPGPEWTGPAPGPRRHHGAAGGHQGSWTGVVGVRLADPQLPQGSRSARKGSVSRRWGTPGLHPSRASRVPTGTLLDSSILGGKCKGCRSSPGEPGEPGFQVESRRPSVRGASWKPGPQPDINLNAGYASLRGHDS